MLIIFVKIYIFQTEHCISLANKTSLQLFNTKTENRKISLPDGVYPRIYSLNGLSMVLFFAVKKYFCRNHL